MNTLNTPVRLGFMLMRLETQFTPDKPMTVPPALYERIKASGQFDHVMDRIAPTPNLPTQ